ncbi:hypothetical protein M2146_001097 [Lachnospiraceae bacterium PF1-22]
MTNDEKKLIITLCINKREEYEEMIHEYGMLDSRCTRLGGQWSGLHLLVEKLGLLEEYEAAYKKIEVN